MSTRGYICIEREDRRCEGFYRNHDCYLEGVGLPLITTPGGHTGNIARIQEILDNQEEVITSFNWTDAYAKGNEYGCDWFYVRKKDVWYCMSYFSDAMGLIPVAEMAIQEALAPWKEDYNYIEEEYNSLKKEYEKLQKGEK